MLAQRASAEYAIEVTILIHKLNRLRKLKLSQREICDMIDTINTMLIPRAWIGIDANDDLHVTYLYRDIAENYNIMPVALNFAADFTWSYDQMTKTFTCGKSRKSDSFPSGSVIKGCQPERL